MSEQHKAKEREVDAIEREISELRTDLDRTLDAIEHKLSPGVILENIVEHAHNSSSVLANRIGAVLWKQPISAALASFGVKWFMSSRKRAGGGSREQFNKGRGRASSLKRRSVNLVKNLKDEISDKVLATTDKVHGDIIGTKRTVQTHLRDTRMEVGQYAHDAKDRIAHSRRDVEGFVSDQPVVTAAIALVIGGVLAAFFPPTAAERKTLGKSGRKLRSKTKKVIARSIQQADELAGQLLETATHKLEESAGNKSALH